jgi:hypothetical protein
MHLDTTPLRHRSHKPLPRGGGQRKTKKYIQYVAGTNDAAIPLPCKPHPKWLEFLATPMKPSRSSTSSVIFGRVLLIGGSSYCGVLDLVSIGLAEYALDPSSEVYDDSGGSYSVSVYLLITDKITYKSLRDLCPSSTPPNL